MTLPKMKKKILKLKENNEKYKYKQINLNKENEELQ